MNAGKRRGLVCHLGLPGMLESLGLELSHLHVVCVRARELRINYFDGKRGVTEHRNPQDQRSVGSAPEH